MNLLHKLCGLLTRHRFRRLIRSEVHLSNNFSRTRWYICRVCGEVTREEE